MDLSVPWTSRSPDGVALRPRKSSRKSCAESSPKLDFAGTRLHIETYWVYLGINPCHCCYSKCWFKILLASSSLTHCSSKICISFGFSKDFFFLWQVFWLICQLGLWFESLKATTSEAGFNLFKPSWTRQLNVKIFYERFSAMQETLKLSLRVPCGASLVKALTQKKNF